MRSSLFFILMLFVLFSCRSDSGNDEVLFKRDLNDIKTKGVIKVVTDYNSVNYFIYKGLEIGYQYELLTELTKSLGLKLELSFSNDISVNMAALKRGDVDLIATNLSESYNLPKGVSFTEPHTMSRQVLIQRGGNEEVKVKNRLDLGKKKIYVEEGAWYYDRLKELQRHLSDSIDVVIEPDYTVEQLIGLVGAGEIDYTVCEENIALVNRYYYPNINIELALSEPQKIAWAIRTNSPELQKAINGWLNKYKHTYEYAKIYQKYFLNDRSLTIVDTKAHLIKRGKLSVFDDLLKSESKNLKWDWRLLASIVYQESRFDPEAKSWAGAEGLMQLMPETATQFGVKNINSPRDNVKGGVRYLQWLQTKISPRVPNEKERIKFLLAAYNVGLGHVLDAMRLAEKYGKNPSIWTDNVDVYLLNKSLPEYYNDTIVKCGYCRGEEPYKYVEEVLTRYDNLKQVLN